MRAYRYRGEFIRECERAPGEHLGPWIVQTYHGPTGMPYADELCPHYGTLAAAREGTREYTRFKYCGDCGGWQRYEIVCDRDAAIGDHNHFASKRKARAGIAALRRLGEEWRTANYYVRELQ